MFAHIRGFLGAFPGAGDAHQIPEAPTMPLTDSAIRAAKPGEKDRKLTDEKGLHLLVTPTGSKLWRLKYRYGGKEKKLALGSYPEISLEEARYKAEDARRQLLNGIDPSAAKKLAAIGRHSGYAAADMSVVAASLPTPPASCRNSEQ